MVIEQMILEESINSLFCYALDNYLIDMTEIEYSKNRILELLKVEKCNLFEIKDYDVSDMTITELLEPLIEYAIKKKIIKDIFYEKENLSARIMDIIMPRPSTVVDTFCNLKYHNSKLATDYLYNISVASNYVQKDRISKNIHYNHKSQKYGDFRISINLSKPEKDPKEIALLKKKKRKAKYPRTPLDINNVGCHGTINRPPRQNLRVAQVYLNDGKLWHLQYSPYGYYNEHSIVFSNTIRNMQIDRTCFENLISFVEQFPHYFIGSNADLPIVGGSILNHDHYQCGADVLPMENAEDIASFKIKGYPRIKTTMLKWPLTVIRLESKLYDKEQLINLAEKIFSYWLIYSDEKYDIMSSTGNERHNTITPIARIDYLKDRLQLDLVLRNNRTTEKRPYGIFHPREKYHNIKKENIGLIEVMGLAILPARLKSEMEEINQILRSTTDLETALSMMEANEDVKKHIEFLKENFDTEFMRDDYMKDLYKYIGNTYEKILEDCAVFKCDEDGIKGIKKFIKTIK